MKKKRFLSILLVMLIVVAPIPNNKIAGIFENVTIVAEHDLDYSFDNAFVDTTYPYKSLRNDLSNNTNLNINAHLNGKNIMIEDSLDLYNWSMDVSYKNTSLSHSKKQELLQQNYVLGNNIDYSERKSDRFFPIGYYDEITDNKLEFTGTFDGRGFEIRDLYFVVFYEYQFLDSLNQVKTPANYFSMFNYNDGTIKNIGLINPIIDLENELPMLQYFAYLVGENTETVSNVYVEDNRGALVGGIKALASQVDIDNMKSASGIIHTNKGTFTNSYFAGSAVVNDDYKSLISEEPLVYNNLGSILGIVYSGSVYTKAVDNGIKENNLKNTSILSTAFEYYPDDGYPKLYKLEKNIDDVYMIGSSVDLIYFTTLIQLRTVKGGVAFNESSYVLQNSINLNDVSVGAYQTPKIEFQGSLKGNVINDKYPQINNLTITEGVKESGEIYFGMFSAFSGKFFDIAFYNVKIKPSGSLYDDVNSHFYIGFLAGVLNNAEVRNVFIEGEIDLTGSQIGAFNVGGLAGEASGVVERILLSSNSLINIGNQNYASKTMGNDFSLGGIIGGTGDSKLTLYNAFNKASVIGLSGATTTLNSVNFYFGGVIGYVNNTVATKHNIGLISNKGNLTALNLINSSAKEINYYLAGVIGYSSGNTYDLSDTYGKWSNSGDFSYDNLNTTTVNIAGVINSNHNVSVEFIKIYNENDLTLINLVHNVSSLVNHLTNVNLTISQAKSSGDYNLDVNKSVGLAVYLKEANPVLTLNYVEVYNNLNYNGTPTTETYLAGIVCREKVNFLNVVYGGDMEVSFSGTRILWVSGFTHLLTSGYYIKNGINEGNIYINHHSTGNLYVGGFVNRNVSGDLHNQDNNIRPKATIGILNSINLADIEVLATNTGRTFVGGIVTLNGATTGGSIQDAINAGNITARNSKTDVANPTVAGDDIGGVITSYNSGVTVAGIAAMAVYGQSRIYDTSNKGDIVGIAQKFVRSGGVLGSALRQEASSGGLSGYYSSSTTGNNSIGESIVSNGINDGKVQAITEKIGSYGNNTTTTATVQYRSGLGTSVTLGFPISNQQTYPTRTSTQERPGVYSAAGGVIGYGLSKMYRMINHGEISATDVAGGVVGATSVVENTTVNINTAINYGDIRAVRVSDYSDVYDNKLATTSNFYDEDDEFLYPDTRTDIRLMPETKRGFGGVFGRLQRGTSKQMGSDGGSFNYVVNMNENIDLIGRLDQVYDFTSTTRFFNFTDAIFYSAKKNDTTQAVLLGYQYERKGTSSATFEIKNYEYEYMTDPEGYPLYRYRMTGGNRYVPRGTQTQNITVYYKKSDMNDYVESGRVVTSSPDYNNTSRYTSTTISAGQWSEWLFDDGSPKLTQTNDISGAMNWITQSAAYNFVYPIPEVTEIKSEATSTRHYVYNPYFVMRDDTTTIGTNQYITSYIYYAENNLLAPRHAKDRINGMYVLASSSGSNFGAVLPKNFIVNKARKINTAAPNYLDYENVSEEYLISDLKTSYGAVFAAYVSLYQTDFNDKSALLKEGQSLKIKDKNYPTEVFYQSDNFTGDSITFVVNKDMINPSTETFTLNFELLKALIPEGALIAKVDADQTELLTFSNKNPGAIIATGDLGFDLLVTITDRADLIGQKVELGAFTSYSQAAINDAGFMPNYKTTYTVYLEVLDTNISNPTLSAIRIDSGDYDSNNLDATQTITNSIGLKINDGSNKLQNGYALDDFLSLYYFDGTKEHLVDSDYYEVVSVLKAGPDFTTDVYFSQLLRPGSYVLKYRYYENDVNKEILINYNKAQTNNFIEFKPYTSKNYDGVTADIDFGYDLANINGFTMERSVNTKNIPIYLAGYYVYEIDFLESFVKTDFFEFDNITTTLEITDEGYKRYQIDFVLGDETVLTKYIIERRLSPNYYKDNSSLPKVYDAVLELDVASTTATREAENTILSLDYKLPQDFYNSDNFSIMYTFAGGSSVGIDGKGKLIYSTFTERLNLIMTKEALPGEYVITVKYKRDEKEINAGKITVTKLAGTSGYLTNIKFSRFVVGNEYPTISVVNNDNTIIDPNPKYSLGMYYNGINYSGADTDNQQYIRIDGTVARIPLNFYMPVNITNYLPDGAMIKRKIYTSATTFVWSGLVDGSFTAEEIQAELATDFTLNPKTGEFTEDKVYIEYMVVPENEKSKPINTQQGVTYFISITDITYTFLAMFNFWYAENGVIERLDNTLDFDKTLVVLSMYNYEVSKQETVLEDTYPETEILNLEFDKIETIYSRLFMFYYVDFQTKENYLYQIGNNLSGFYNIRIMLPNGYVYKIYINNYEDEDNLLPLFSDYIDDIEGYFYYINTSSITRTRYFQVVIEKGETIDNSWGLTDNKKTWED